MKCDRCGKASVYHSTIIVNGVAQSTNLCRDCAIKEGVFSSEPTSLFEDMFSHFASILPFDDVKDIKCPVCKTTLRQFKTTQKLGCPNCYDAFREELNSLIAKIAPYSTHKQATVHLDTESKPKTNQDKIATLRSEMQLAVKEERYEDAAKLKKQIQKLEAKDE